MDLLGNIKIKHGVTRTVILIGDLAFKFPKMTSISSFCNGVLGNINEINFGKESKGERYSRHLMPVLKGSTPFMVIMPRGEDMNIEYYQKHIEPYYFERIGGITHPFSECIDPDNGNKLPVENKICSWKLYKGRWVAVDYGGF